MPSASVAFHTFTRFFKKCTKIAVKNKLSAWHIERLSFPCVSPRSQWFSGLFVSALSVRLGLGLGLGILFVKLKVRVRQLGNTG